MAIDKASKNGFAYIPVIIVIALLVVGTGTVAASDTSKPGDFLYPLDRSIENMRLSSISNDEEKVEFKAKVLGERISEAKELESEEDREEDHATAVSAAKDEVDEFEALLTAGVLSADDLAALFERYNITELEYSVETEDGEQKIELKIKGTDEEGNEFEFEPEDDDKDMDDGEDELEDEDEDIDNDNDEGMEDENDKDDEDEDNDDDDSEDNDTDESEDDELEDEEDDDDQS